MTTTAQTLRDTARDLADAYHWLATTKWTPRKHPAARKMKPQPGPRTPTPDNDTALNIEYSLLYETTENHIPGGLLTITLDALSYTPHRGRAIHPTTGQHLCALIARHAKHIATNFPAATDLEELMQNQTTYITNLLEKLDPPSEADPTHEPAYSSTMIIKLLAQKGHTITRQHLHKWTDRGNITAITTHGKRLWRLSEVTAWIER